MVDREYYGEVREAFDQWSESYDRRFQVNPINRYVRMTSLGVLLDSFREAQRVLEIGCGTGDEAICLARRGVEVVATDISAKMLDVLDRKAEREGLQNKIELVQLAARNLDVLLDGEGDGEFDGAYSSLAALNCEPSLGRVARALHRLVEPGGLFVASLKNRLCLLELIGHSLALRPWRGLSRLRRPTEVNVTSAEIEAYPYFPDEFLDFFLPAFDLDLQLGLPAFLPPAEFHRLFRSQELLSFMESFDRRLNFAPPFNRYGDYFLVRLSNSA